MSETQKKRGPADGYVRMTFDMERTQRDKLRILAARMTAAKGQVVNMADLLKRYVAQGMAEDERKLPRSK